MKKIQKHKRKQIKETIIKTQTCTQGQTLSMNTLVEVFQMKYWKDKKHI